jgi:DNA replication protein DnaC
LTWVRDRRMFPEEDPAAWQAALKRAGIPERFWTADPALVKGNNRWIHQAIEDTGFWAAKGYGFFLHGEFNTGKSAAAAILAMEFIRRCHVVTWLPVRDVPRVRFHEGDGADTDTRLRTTDLLVVDDLGSERFRLESAAGGALEEVVRIVYERSRPVLLTSNKAWTEFPTTYAKIPAFVSLVTRLSFPIALGHQWPNAPNMPGFGGST